MLPGHRSWEIWFSDSLHRRASCMALTFGACLAFIGGLVFQKLSLLAGGGLLLSLSTLILLEQSSNVPFILIRENGSGYWGSSKQGFILTGPYLITPWFVFFGVQQAMALEQTQQNLRKNLFHQLYLKSSAFSNRLLGIGKQCFIWRDSLSPIDDARLRRTLIYLRSQNLK